MRTVSVVALETYDDQTRANEAIERLLAPLSLESAIRPGMRVLIKPNLLAGRRPDLCVTTHPALIRALALWLRGRGISDIVLADSPGGPYQGQWVRGVYKACGLTDLEDVLTLNADFTSGEVEAEPGFPRRAFSLIRPVLRADYIINFAKMKTHGMMTVSLGVKNLLGCVPGLLKPKLHYAYPEYDAFADMLVSLCETVGPRLTLIDAVDAMEGDGPGSGTPRRVGMVLASEHVYSADFVAVRLMGLEPDGIPLIRAYRRRGFLREEEISVVGDAAAPADPPLRLPSHARALNFLGHAPAFVRRPLNALVDRATLRLPRVLPGRCVGCGRCAESCPRRIIRVENGKAVIGRQGCIRCFCCQEMCPVKAVTVRRAFRFGTFGRRFRSHP